LIEGSKIIIVTNVKSDLLYTSIEIALVVFMLVSRIDPKIITLVVMQRTAAHPPPKASGFIKGEGKAQK